MKLPPREPEFNPFPPDLDEEIERTKKNPVQPRIYPMSDIEAKEVFWLWHNRISSGRMSLLVGYPGLGKTFVTCDIAARISNGQPFPDGAPCEQGDVLILNAEDNPNDTLRPRLDAHNADVSRIHLLSGSYVVGDDDKPDLMVSLNDIPVIEEAFKRLPQLRLFVIDPVGSFIGGKTDAHRDNEVRSVLAPIGRLAEEYDVAVLLVAHPNKSANARADDAVLGSRAFTGIVRSVWHLSTDVDDKERRLLLPGKNNLGPDMPGLAFSIGGEFQPSIRWEADPVEMTADESLAEHRDESNKNSRAKTRTKCEEWLCEYLADAPVEGVKVKADGQGKGFSIRTIQRAAKSLGIQYSSHGGAMWSLPNYAEFDANSP